MLRHSINPSNCGELAQTNDFESQLKTYHVSYLQLSVYDSVLRSTILIRIDSFITHSTHDMFSSPRQSRRPQTFPYPIFSSLSLRSIETIYRISFSLFIWTHRQSLLVIYLLACALRVCVGPVFNLSGASTQRREAVLSNPCMEQHWRLLAEKIPTNGNGVHCINHVIA